MAYYSITTASSSSHTFVLFRIRLLLLLTKPSHLTLSSISENKKHITYTHHIIHHRAIINVVLINNRKWFRIKQNNTKKIQIFKVQLSHLNIVTRGAEVKTFLITRKENEHKHNNAQHQNDLYWAAPSSIVYISPMKR